MSTEEPIIKMRIAILGTLSLALLAGCNHTTATPTQESPKQLPPNVGPAKLTVTLLGDDVRVNLAEQLGSDSAINIVAPPKESDAVDVAAAAFNSDFVLLVTDATQGPLPVHREHAMILRQLEIDSIGLLFANTRQLAGMSDASELLELEELEVREVLNTYDLPGDTVTSFYDAKLSAIDSAEKSIAGIAAIIEWLKRREPKSRRSPVLSPAKKLESDIYLMSRQESAHSKTLANGDSVRIFINGQVRDASIAAVFPLRLASSSQAVLHIDKPVPCAVDDLFVVIIDGHAVGSGSVTSIKP